MSRLPSVSSVQRSTLDWGLTRYDDAWRRQIDLVQKRLNREIEDTLVLTEHEPVYTLGVRKESADHIVWTANELTAKGISVVQSNRGGDITYHGPGQIVGYGIVDLSHTKDLHAWLRTLEQIVIDAIGTLGVISDHRPGKTGIWVENRKIAAIGVAVRRWVTYHGFALNVSNDLAPFSGIIPCGIAPADGTVTSLSLELGQPVDLSIVKARLSESFWVHLDTARAR